MTGRRSASELDSGACMRDISDMDPRLGAVVFAHAARSPEELA
jgi:hypothetical protein